MKLQFKLFIFILYTFISGFLLPFGQSQEIDIGGPWKRLSEIHQKWLQYTSIPEAARLLQYPPYSYHTSDFRSDALNLSKFISDDVLFSWDTFMDNGTTNAKCSDDLIQVLSNLESQWALQSKLVYYY